MRLSCCQAESDREPLRIDDGVAFGRKPVSGTTETMISIRWNGDVMMSERA
nr:E220 [uncultured bacterium]